MSAVSTHNMHMHTVYEQYWSGTGAPVFWALWRLVSTTDYRSGSGYTLTSTPRPPHIAGTAAVSARTWSRTQRGQRTPCCPPPASLSPSCWPPSSHSWSRVSRKYFFVNKYFYPNHKKMNGFGLKIQTRSKI